MKETAKKILIPVDFTEYSEEAIRWGLRFAEIYDASLLLLHVVETGSFFEELVEDRKLMDRRRELALQKLEAIQSAHPSARLRLMIKVGKPYRNILETIEEEKIDMTILGIHGHGEDSGYTIGSNVELVIREANCPVIVVSANLNIDSVKNVLIAVDPDVGMKGLRKIIGTYYRTFNPRINLVSFYDESHSTRSWEDFKEFLGWLKKSMERLGIKDVETEILPGFRPVEELVRFAETNDYDMIWMETHEYMAFEKYLTARSAQQVVSLSSIPVLSLKEENVVSVWDTLFQQG